MKISTSTQLLWSALLLAWATLSVASFLLWRRHHGHLFHSTLEMFLVFALVAVTLVGIFVKSRKN